MKKSRFSEVSSVLVLILLLALLGGTTAAAQEAGPEQDPLAAVTVRADMISWQPKIEGAGFVLAISGPGDFFWEQQYQPGDRFIFRPTGRTGAPLPDGLYKYELRPLPLETPAEYAEEKRGLVPSAEAPVQSGSFSILAGRIVTQDATEGVTGNAVAGTLAPNDQIINDDLIVMGSECIGFDCANGESFGFDTLIFKENNLRVYFNDTSSTGSFPSNDWRLIANDSANGGASYFGIEDATHARRVFSIEAGAPSNSLYVDSGGDVGLGTSTPVLELHIADSDTPSVRLQQDSSGGWSPQTWDVAGNESNFFIRDATNGSKLPFRIQPSAPSSSLFIASDGDVGLGTSSPEAALAIVRTGSNPKLALQRTDGDKWVFNAAPSGLRFAANDPVEAQALLDTSGNLTIQGALTEASDVNAKENFAAVNPRVVLETLAGLSITSWNFKFDAPDLRHMGPVAQDFYEAFGLGIDDKHIAPLDTNGVALVAIQGLHEIMQEKDVQLGTLQEKNAELEARLTALEQASARPAPETSFLTVLPWLLSGILLVAVAAMTGKRLSCAKA